MKYHLALLLSLLQTLALAQFAPPAGQLGTTAIHKDSSAIVAWATGCTLVRGYEDISNTSLGYASAGDSSMCLGIAGSNGVASLGDGGYAVLTFASPISNGSGWDFAVFENSFSDNFLELAYVEVSSDGINYFRFPCTSYTQNTTQIDGFGSTDATKIDNLAGKYRALYGTPFDLQQLASLPGLNVNAITHIKIIDVVGCIQNGYASFDQYGNKINDPWRTPFASGGFDLDAIGVIHTNVTGTNELYNEFDFNVYPNPAVEMAFINLDFTKASEVKVIIADFKGNEMKTIFISNTSITNHFPVSLLELNDGIYFISVYTQAGVKSKKLVITK